MTTTWRLLTPLCYYISHRGNLKQAAAVPFSLSLWVCAGLYGGTNAGSQFVYEKSWKQGRLFAKWSKTVSAKWLQDVCNVFLVIQWSQTTLEPQICLRIILLAVHKSEGMKGWPKTQKKNLGNKYESAQERYLCNCYVYSWKMGFIFF